MTAFLHFMQVFGVIFGILAASVVICMGFAMIVFFVSELLDRYFDETWYRTICILVWTVLAALMCTGIYFFANIGLS